MTVRALKAGAANFLTKPFDDEDLLNAIRQCITSCDEERLDLESTGKRKPRCERQQLANSDSRRRRPSTPARRDRRTRRGSADMTLVAEAANGREAIQQFRTHRPDVTLMDIQMPEMNGLDALIAIRTEFPDAKVIMLTTYEGDVHILRALKAGAQGYLLKNTLHSELLQTIRAVHAGKRSLSPEASFQVAEHMSDQALTPAEVVVLRLIAAGNANKQIADQLAITRTRSRGASRAFLRNSTPTTGRMRRSSA